VAARTGLRVPPSDGEREERAAVHAVSQHWPGPRTISVVNGKGGAGKTPTTALLAAVFARHGGAGVLAWDNNQTRGTLGWRTEQGPHEATLHELLPAATRLLGPSAQAADLARFVHHQPRDRYDVLRSKPADLRDTHRLDPADVDAIHALATKYYRLVVIDSGNDESDPLWLRMIDHTDQLVVATTTGQDHAEAAALLIEALRARDDHSARLAASAVVVVTQADRNATARTVGHIVAGFTGLAPQTLVIPHDPAMVDGLLSYTALRPATRRAWLTAASAVAARL
jgi:MinD-like ATPase involved in chromosome partitioning or flagellar assembly